MNIKDNDEQAIRDTVNLYFMGTYQGDVEQVKRAFHPDATISGSIDNEIYNWTLAEFISRISTVTSAASKNEKYDKEIIFVDIIGDAAIMKARVVIGPYVFTDYITLLKIAGKWIIRNKSFST